ncbi:MAG: DUF222 domain-containing protein [Acidimicrobiales bacterium]
MELEDLVEAVDQLLAADPQDYADTESVRCLERQLTRLEAFVTRSVAAFDAAGAWAPSGARNATAWLGAVCRMPSAEARRQVRRGRQLRHLPACERAWGEGEVSATHLDTIAALRFDTTEAALARDEAMLVDQARRLPYRSFVRAARYWQSHADPDGAEEDAMARRARRDVYLVESVGGTWLGQMTLDPISGAIVSAELERRERALFEEDWAQARGELGRDPLSSELARTPGQRRADALVEMATRSAIAPEDGRRPAPLFSVLVGYETLHGPICELAQGARSVLAPGSLLPWLDQAYIERAVFSPEGRVEVSATARLFSGATRRAIELRDRECTHPLCDATTRLQVDHIEPAAAGGPTTQENGRILCGFHNRLRNQRPPPEAPED